ncbi:MULTISPECIES: GlxA family transcriptional regulator [unclassified Mesorhizobium]|uniref:GlxA family transcriptional regulator n=1 Tax=unclassified Mesorhizobium TaxID=325217 RepID=UPI001FE1E602|nr:MULTISPECIES: GlxA family transcriptional regulator [unclassified Mesorhizobium]
MFYLVPGFSMLALSSAVEALRLANYVLGCNAYDWRLASRDGRHVNADFGFEVPATADLESERKQLASSGRPSLVLVCANSGVASPRDRALEAWLRECRLRGVTIGGLGSASHIIAEAGLLNRHRCAVHWKEWPSFGEKFPEVQPSYALYHGDGGIWTCAGGSSAFDMMLQIVSQNRGDHVAASICDEALIDQLRPPSARQRVPLSRRSIITNKKIVAMMEQMQMNLTEPLSIEDLAARVQLSRRQVERLFRELLGLSPVRYYRELRLKQANILLTQTDIQIVEIAISCGFASASHFSKCYRESNGMSPQQARKALRPRRIQSTGALVCAA